MHRSLRFDAGKLNRLCPFVDFFRAPAKRRVTRLRLYALAQPFTCSLDSASAVRNPERTKRHFYDTEGTEHHRCIDMTHVSNSEGLAVQLTKPTSERDAALEIAIVVQKARIASVGEEHGCHRIRTLAGFCDIELDCFSFLPS